MPEANIHMSESALERLARCSNSSEIWWDSSPLVYSRWRSEVLERHGQRLRHLGEHLDRFFHPEGPPYGYLRGSTTNQPITLQALEADPQALAPWVREMAQAHPGWPVRKLAWEAFTEMARRGAELLHGIFEESCRRYGYICCQVDPRLNDNAEAMVAQAVEAHAKAPNIMIKMPGTRAGIEGVRELTAMGIPTTVTLSFSVPQLIAVGEAVEKGLQEAARRGTGLSAWRCNGVMMLGRFEDHPEFKRQAGELGLELSPAELRWAGIAVFKRAYAIYKERGYKAKLLAASMRLGPTVDGRERIWHLEKLAGADAVLTIFPNIIEAFLLAYDEEPICSCIEDPVPEEVLRKLLRIPYFRQAYEEDGLRAEEFDTYPPIVATAQSFTEAMEQFEARIDAMRG